MKKNCWLLFGVMLSSGLMAQQTTTAPANAPIETPAPAAMITNAPSGATNASPVKKKSSQKKHANAPAKKKEPAAELRTTPLVPGPATVDANNVNVRGQAKLKSEVVTRLKKGDAVTVLSEITRNNSGPDEPSAWAKIVLPATAHIWISTKFIDGTNKTVTPKKLNLRSGPGENYSVIGQLQHGDPVKDLNTKGEWTEIEAPTNAFAFIAAQYLKQEALPASPAVASTEPAPPPTTVTEAPPIAAAPTETPPTSSAPAAAAAAPTEPASQEPAPAPADQPPPKRIVQREGFVRGTTSIQAPTHFGLVSAQNGKLMDYLFTTSPNLDLRRYKGLRIIVTGEEGLDDRWGNTPVLTIQKIQVMDDAAQSGL